MKRSPLANPWPAESEAVLLGALGLKGVWGSLLDRLPVSLAHRIGAWRASFVTDRVLDETTTERRAGFLAGETEPESADDHRRLAAESYRCHSIADAEAWAARRISPVKLCQGWQLSGWKHLESAGDGAPGNVIVIPRLAGWGIASRALMLYREGLQLLGPSVPSQLLREASYQLARGTDVAWLVEPQAQPNGAIAISQQTRELATAAGSSLLAIQALRQSPQCYQIEIAAVAPKEELTKTVERFVGVQIERWPWGVQRWPEA